MDKPKLLPLDRGAVVAFLDRINERNPHNRQFCLDKCAANPATLKYILKQNEAALAAKDPATIGNVAR